MRGRGIRVGLALAAVSVAALVAQGGASGSLTNTLVPSCGVESHPFAQWGDPDAYCAFPNLGFEDGTVDWTVSGDASTVSANEPWYVSGFGTHALRLGPGARALSSPLPVSVLDPWIRFFARSAGADGALDVQVIFRGWLGNATGVLNVGSLVPGDFSSWQPTQRVLSTLALPLGTSTAQVLLSSVASSGSWEVDDVYLDPCKMKLG